MIELVRLNTLNESELNEAKYREFSRQDYRTYSCEEFSDGSSPLIYTSESDIDVILFPKEDEVDGLQDNTGIEIIYYSEELRHSYTWISKLPMSKSEAIFEFETIIKLVERIQGEPKDIVNDLRRIGRKFLMTFETSEL